MLQWPDSCGNWHWITTVAWSLPQSVKATVKSLSYWPDENSIRNWKQASEHLLAQQFGSGSVDMGFTVAPGRVLRPDKARQAQNSWLFKRAVTPDGRKNRSALRVSPLSGLIQETKYAV